MNWGYVPCSLFYKSVSLTGIRAFIDELEEERNNTSMYITDLALRLEAHKQGLSGTGEKCLKVQSQTVKRISQLENLWVNWSMMLQRTYKVDKQTAPLLSLV